jgi:cation-transporting P-type ATPase E
LRVQTQAKVIRNGVEKSIDPDEIVQGDVLICQAGDQIFADGHVIEGNHFSVDESNLTGESERVYKTTGDSILSGSFCLAGSAYYEAEKVGVESHLTQLTAAARFFRQEKTPLQRDVDTVIRVLIVVVTLLGMLLGISSIYSRSTTVDYLRIAAVIVALVPQGLFVMTTVAYGMGILRVARKGALIQETNAVESTSHINLLCLDKTGTLTTQRLHLSEVIPLGKSRENRELLDTALGDFAINMETADRTISAIRRDYPGKSRMVSRMTPFSSEYKWSALGYSDDKSKATYVLGAPEVLASKIHRRDEILSEVDRLSGLALRVLLFSRSNYPASISKGVESPELPPDLEPLGLIVFQEELRGDARQTLEHFSNLGVKKLFDSLDPIYTIDKDTNGI